MNKVLTIVDTAGIQDYVFRTNKLRQIIGASTLVNYATDEWVKSALDPAQNKVFQELVYSGGGNAVLIFNDIEKAKKFASALSKIVIEKAPGLRLVVSHKEFDDKNDILGGENGIISQTFKQLDKLKAEGDAWTYETSLGVTEECLFSAQAVVLESLGKGNDTPLSCEALAKQTVGSDQLKEIRRVVDGNAYTFYYAEDMDHITGKTSDKNLIGIVHIDGNDIGTKIKGLVNKYMEPGQNEQLLNVLRGFSDSIKIASKKTFEGLLDCLILNLHGTSLLLSGGDEINLYEKNGNLILPIRPIVLGGDDMTLICDGSLALDLTVRYLKLAQKQSLSDGSKYNCKAGVCIVKKNFPVYPAYQLSNQLASSAKKFRQELKQELEEYYKNVSPSQAKIKAQDLPTIDWQICLNGIKGSLSEIRQTEYMVENGELLMRPLFIPDLNEGMNMPDLDSSWRTWPHYLELFEEINRLPRNKAKELRDYLRLSVAHIVNYLMFNQINLRYGIGWHNNRCPYFDVLEIQDIYKELA